MTIHNDYIKKMCASNKYKQHGIFTHIRNNIFFEPYSDNCCCSIDEHEKMIKEQLSFININRHPDFWRFNLLTSDYEWHEVVWSNDISKQKMNDLYLQKDYLEGFLSKLTNQYLGLNLYIHNIKTNQYMEIDIYQSACFVGNNYKQIVTHNKSLELFQ